MLDAIHLTDMHSLSLRPLGEQLAEAFASPAMFDLDVAREGNRLEKAALLEWGRLVHAGDLSSEEARILRKALQGGEEAEFDDASRWSMLQLIRFVDPEGKADEKQLLKRCLAGIASFENPENQLSCSRIEAALRVQAI